MDRKQSMDCPSWPATGFSLSEIMTSQALLQHKSATLARFTEWLVQHAYDFYGLTIAYVTEPGLSRPPPVTLTYETCGTANRELVMKFVRQNLAGFEAQVGQTPSTVMLTYRPPPPAF